MDYQRGKWNNQTYIEHGFVLPEKADPLIIYFVRLGTFQEILKWQHISSSIYSKVLFLNPEMKIRVILCYSLGRNLCTVPFLSLGEDLFTIFLLFSENSC